MGVWQRLIQNAGVDQRYWSRPLPEVTTPTSVGHRARVAFGDALDLAETAARQALDVAGLDPGDVDAIVTSHTTSWTVPGLDVHLVERLGLRPTVARLPLSTLACAGGAQGLVRALQSEDTPQSMIYKALFGDSAGACVVTGVTADSAGTLPPAGFIALDTFEVVLPASRDRYWGTIDDEGLHFESTKAAAHAAADVLPYLTDWIGDRTPEWAVIHPGGPRIIDDVAVGLGLDPDKDARHSHASLADVGNLGGCAVLDVLRRTYDDPPEPGAPGVLTAFGPGFTVAAVRGAWT
jgi:predicted naringenin-chalcone synthase